MMVELPALQSFQHKSAVMKNEVKKHFEWVKLYETIDNAGFVCLRYGITSPYKFAVRKIAQLTPRGALIEQLPQFVLHSLLILKIILLSSIQTLIRLKLVSINMSIMTFLLIFLILKLIVSI
ncbi:hypothetical protein [Sphingobacterium faecium]|uniref:hypothetical protein n=1 Tax=Sphingobacterium faecium TaxID=34087 RepID=UPI003209039B